MSDDNMSLSEFAKTPEAQANAATWENLRGHGNRDGSAKPMTPQEMLDAWRQLLADGHRVIPGEGFFIIQGKEHGQVVRMDPDPLRAFEKTYRAFQEGTAGR